MRVAANAYILHLLDALILCLNRMGLYVFHLQDTLIFCPIGLAHMFFYYGKRLHTFFFTTIEHAYTFCLHRTYVYILSSGHAYTCKNVATRKTINNDQIKLGVQSKLQGSKMSVKSNIFLRDKIVGRLLTNSVSDE